jgi:hypothetical protein
MKHLAAATALAVTFAQLFAGIVSADPGIRQEAVQFAKGASSAVVNGQLEGDATVDYVVRAAAGQTLTVRLRTSNAQNFFNVLPPGSTGSAMFVGVADDDYSGMLPADGDYVVRVYLMRPAARRGESSHYTLAVGVTGQALAPSAASRDALLTGTAYHASAKIPCVPAFESTPRECDAFVVRRGFDGTATVDISARADRRSILFVKGKAVASNAPALDALSVERRGDATVVKLGTTERYEIPDALISGG